jgi:hypothetical protein
MGARRYVDREKAETLMDAMKTTAPAGKERPD